MFYLSRYTLIGMENANITTESMVLYMNMSWQKCCKQVYQFLKVHSLYAYVWLANA